MFLAGLKNSAFFLITDNMFRVFSLHHTLRYSKQQWTYVVLKTKTLSVYYDHIDYIQKQFLIILITAFIPL